MASADAKQPGYGGKSLLDVLPSELVIQVIEHLATDRHALCSFARTCRLLQIECEKRIYTAIELLSTNDLRAILEAFSRRPERIASVETLKILYRFHDGLGATSQERQAFNACVAQMKALRDWHVESPFDNFKWDEGPGYEWVEQDMEEFRKALEAASFLNSKIAVLQESFTLGDNRLVRQVDVGLSRLERLVIHSHGTSSALWALDGFHCLFRHPSLRYLHASCFVLPADLPVLEPYAKSTPLTTLVFDECDLNPTSVGRILRTPKALRHLTLGENVYNIEIAGIVAPRLSRAPEASLEALKEVAHSLETLTHHDPFWKVLDDSYGHRPIKGDGMRDYHLLKFMDIDPCSFLHQILLCYTQAPPNLKKLRLHHERTRTMDFTARQPLNVFEELPTFQPYTYLSSLKTLEFVQAASSEAWIASPGHICEGERLRERHAYAYKLHKHGIALKMYLQATWRRGLMPPYLHGEPEPELVSVYDSTRIGFRRHITPPEDISSFVVRPNDLLALDELYRSLGTGHLPMLGLPTTCSHTPPPTHANDEEAPETDQLNDADIQHIRNELTRRLNRVWMRMAKADTNERELPDFVLANEDEEIDDSDDLDGEFMEEWFDDEDDEDEDEDMYMDEDEFEEELEQFMTALGGVEVDLDALEGHHVDLTGSADAGDEDGME
ncbi:hypothetical protein K458DRAFT_301222 [Lentithecium fluviatile CBS 122367]|uniref:F-box domain-containing protein n=1 Tax=Lentithecium fluviatile CBS 122367 TaxID=1168545 RepID=A0A6G1J5F4_9PLEO|nr:hypothetical protein K458DRAFT_301222 [Lentithecium fluviatile CBS 122367]